MMAFDLTAGVQVAYKSYKALTDLNGGEDPLPVTLSKYNHDQIFFLSFAHMFCGKPSVEQIEMILLSGGVTDEFAVKGALQNIPEFAAAWKCPAGSPMAPAQKCSIWK